MKIGKGIYLLFLLVFIIGCHHPKTYHYKEWVTEYGRAGSTDSLVTFRSEVIKAYNDLDAYAAGYKSFAISRQVIFTSLQNTGKSFVIEFKILNDKKEDIFLKIPVKSSDSIARQVDRLLRRARQRK